MNVSAIDTGHNAFVKRSDHEGKEMEQSYLDKIKELDRVIEELGPGDLNNSTKDKKLSFLKKRNALYSQRKYYRKKVKIMHLQKERDDFIKKNTVTKKENQILEEMLVSVKEHVSAIELLKTKEAHAQGLAASAMPSILQSDDRCNALTSAEVLASTVLDCKPPSTCTPRFAGPTTPEPFATELNLVPPVTGMLMAPHLVHPGNLLAQCGRQERTTWLHMLTEGRITEYVHSGALHLPHNVGAATSLETPISSLLRRVALNKSLKALNALRTQTCASLASQAGPTAMTMPPPSSILEVLLHDKQENIQEIRDLLAQAQVQAQSFEPMNSILQPMMQQQHHHHP